MEEAKQVLYSLAIIPLLLPSDNHQSKGLNRELDLHDLEADSLMQGFVRRSLRSASSPMTLVETRG
jgi:hypothetical protein